MNAIELKNVSFSYKENNKKVLDEVNFYIDYGEVSLLSGFSGEGKSTLLSIISGIIPNVVSGEITGEVLINGETIKNKKMSEICSTVGVVLQNADSQIIQKFVEDEIAFGCENFAFDREDIKKQIERVCKILNLDDSSKTRTLSGGQKQRLITASTLATGQKILLLDEPLANLDCDGAKLLMNTLKMFANAGYAVLVVEHRLDIILPYVDSVWAIREGKINKIENKKDYLISQTVITEDNAEKHEKGEILFSLKNVSYKVKQKQILSDITFDINKGERLLILGENGCGKTSTLRLIARLNKLSGGRIEQNLNSKFNNGKANSKWFKSVGVVYQNPNYQLFMPSVEKEIYFGAISKEYAEEIITLFNLQDIRHYHPQTLSQGQKRRVSIAAVMATKPQVLLLDEPTVGQDYKALCDLVKILNTLHDKTGNTMITITHDMRCAESLCDRAVIIENGKIKEQGDKTLAHNFFFK